MLLHMCAFACVENCICVLLQLHSFSQFFPDQTLLLLYPPNLMPPTQANLCYPNSQEGIHWILINFSVAILLYLLSLKIEGKSSSMGRTSCTVLLHMLLFALAWACTCLAHTLTASVNSYFHQNESHCFSVSIKTEFVSVQLCPFKQSQNYFRKSNQGVDPKNQSLILCFDKCIGKNQRPT